jgi:UDP-N-acetylmuramyl pentapeptide synthase
MMNSVTLSDSNIIEVHVIGDQTEESVQAMGEEIAVLVDKLKARLQPVFILDDIKEMGETTPAARAMVAQYAKSLDFHGAAMVGPSNPMMRLGTNLMFRAIGKSNVRYFASLEAAMIWFELNADFAKLTPTKP